MKKKNLFVLVLLIAAAMWCFVSCDSDKKTTETAQSSGESAPKTRELSTGTAAPIGGTNGSTKWTVTGSKIQLNGADFFVKGICYAPTPAGAATYEPGVGDWFTPPWNQIWERDLPNMKNDMAINVLKTYFTWPWPPPPDITTWKTVIKNPPQDHKPFLDACYTNNTNRIYVLLGVALDAGNIFNNPNPTLAADFKGFYLAVVDELTRQYGDHPAVMGFVLGNEMNNPDRCKRQDFWSINSEFAQTAKKNAPDKLILQAFQNDPLLFTYKAPYKKEKDGKVQTLTVPEIYYLNYDVWGLNVFNGKTFFPFWSRFKSQVVSTPYNLPLIMTECGVPAGTNDPVDLSKCHEAKAVELPDNAAAVAAYLKSLWNDLIAYKDIVSGATFFEYSDEWWKGNGPGPCVHDVGSCNPASNFPGKYWEPAWWGFYSIAVNGRTCADGPWDNAHNKPYPPDILTPRAAVAAMKGLKLPTRLSIQNRTGEPSGKAPSPTAASSIKITLKTEGNSNYLKDVSGLVVGNMVDPVTGDYWYGPINENPWTWYNQGNNVRCFALLGNYNYNAGSNPGLKTAFSKLVVDPTRMTKGDHEVVAYLCTCKIGPGNIILRFKCATLDGKYAPGIVYVNDRGTHKHQRDCSFFDCPDCPPKAPGPQN